ncbi:transcription factor HES-5-like [Scophthalmus maximus]|uniref:transcription factor HES-5-like n=1 Tax=Scophthalmus maximus TaxID=52904 RepID=UPI000F368C7E|nr:transcription factor HES-5-like [Scophthalmus maximus]
MLMWPINRGAGSSATSQHVLLSTTTMAPTSTTDSPPSQLSTKHSHKLRKPAVEKMRRDRINICIEQLKVLLEEEFHRQDPNAKMEKADVLEMTVAFLRQQLQPHAAHAHGYSRCWKESLHFLSHTSLKEATLPNLQHLQHLYRADRDAASTPAPSSHRHIQAAGKTPSSPHRDVWRPW